MPGPIEQPSLLKVIDDLKKRVETLERSDNKPVHYSVNGHEMKTGLVDGSGNVVTATSDEFDGLMLPAEHAAWTNPLTKGFTSSSWVTLCEAQIFSICADVLVFSFYKVVPSGTVGDVRLVGNGTQVAYKTLPAGSGLVTCRFKHPWGVGFGGGGSNAGKQTSVFLQLQLRRTSGSGTVTAWQPRGLALRSSALEVSASSTDPFSV